MIQTLKLPQDSVLSKVLVTEIIAKIELGEYRILKDYGFTEAIEIFAKAYEEDRYLGYDINFSACKKCEFKNDENTKHKKSGFEQCFKRQLGWFKEDFDAPNVFEIWDFRRWSHLSDAKRLKLEDIDDEEFGKHKQKGNGMGRVQRQLLQKHKALNDDLSIEIIKDGLKSELENYLNDVVISEYELLDIEIVYDLYPIDKEFHICGKSHHITRELDNIVKTLNEIYDKFNFQFKTIRICDERKKLNPFIAPQTRILSTNEIFVDEFVVFKNLKYGLRIFFQDDKIIKRGDELYLQSSKRNLLES